MTEDINKAYFSYSSNEANSFNLQGIWYHLTSHPHRPHRSNQSKHDGSRFTLLAGEKLGYNIFCLKQ